jgi:hypothetical protein
MAIDRIGSAQDLTTRLIPSGTVQLQLRLTVVARVEPFIVAEPSEAERCLDPKVIILAARLRQCHAVLAALSPPGGDNASCRPGAEDHKVEFADTLWLQRIDTKS